MRASYSDAIGRAAGRGGGLVEVVGVAGGLGGVELSDARGSLREARKAAQPGAYEDGGEGELLGIGVGSAVRVRVRRSAPMSMRVSS